MRVILLSILTLILIPLILGLIRTWQVQNSPNQKLFSSGKVPKSPEGLYKGIVNFKTNWQGKRFDSNNSTGINIIGDAEKYSFKTYIGKGLQDQNMEVLKIDYNIPKNPFWLKLILDEIVETEGGKYLGKVHIRLIPGLNLSLGYFKLEK